MTALDAIAKGELTPPGGTIYESRNIVLAADPEVPIPGFLIITGRRHVNSFSMLYKEEWMEIGEVILKAERVIKNLGSHLFQRSLCSGGAI